MLIIITIKIMNVEYIWLASLNAMQIKISFAVAMILISRYAQHVFCPADLDLFTAPARRFLTLPLPALPVRKKAYPTIPGSP